MHAWERVSTNKGAQTAGIDKVTAARVASRGRVNTAVTAFRRHWWGLLAARPGGFPWL